MSVGKCWDDLQPPLEEEEEETRKHFPNKGRSSRNSVSHLENDLQYLSKRMEDMARHVRCLEDELVHVSDQLKQQQQPSSPPPPPPPPPPDPHLEEFIRHYAENGLLVHLRTGLEELVRDQQTFLQHSHDTSARQTSLVELLTQLLK